MRLNYQTVRRRANRIYGAVPYDDVLAALNQAAKHAQALQSELDRLQRLEAAAIAVVRAREALHAAADILDMDELSEKRRALYEAMHHWQETAREAAEKARQA